MDTILHLSPSDVLANLKKRLQMAQRDYLKFPNATRWNVQTRDAFVYQQAFFFLSSVSRPYEDKINMLKALTNEPNGNWGDVICQHALNMSLAPALREHANCP